MIIRKSRPIAGLLLPVAICLALIGCGPSVDEVREETVDPPEELAASKAQAREDAQAVEEWISTLGRRMDELERAVSTEASEQFAAVRADLEDARGRLEEASELGSAEAREAVETLEREIDDLEARVSELSREQAPETGDRSQPEG